MWYWCMSFVGGKKRNVYLVELINGKLITTLTRLKKKMRDRKRTRGK